MFPYIFGKTPRRISVSVWTPLDLTPTAWYIASPTYCFSDAGGTTPCGNGDTVYVWKDHSGNNRTLTQSTPAARPALIQLVNGDWVVRFDGVDDRMPAASSFTYSSDFLFGWIAARSSVGRMIWSTTSGNAIADYYPPDNKIYYQNSAGGLISSAFAGSTSRHYMTISRNSGTVAIRANGSSLGSGLATGDTILQTVGGPSGFYFGGDVSELIAIPSYENPATHLEPYLASRITP